MKVTYPLKACPWCGHTASFYMSTSSHVSWIPEIGCRERKCIVSPTVRSGAIRKSQRGKPDWIKQKVEKVIAIWNSANLEFKNEGFEIDFEKLASDFLSGNIDSMRMRPL